MSTGSKVMAVADEVATVVGSGEGAGALTLCSVSFQANERGCLVEGLAVSSAGDVLEAKGIGGVVPDDGTGSSDIGKLVLTSAPALSVSAAGNRIDLIVSGSSGVAWRGYLRVEAVHDYAV